MDSTSDADAGPVADLDSGQSTSAVACSSASTNGVSASQYASMSISPTAINAVASSRVTNINRSYYDNCACEEAGFGGGIGGGFASVNSSGAIGLDCDPGGTIIVTRDPDVSAVITNFKAFRSFDCGPRRPGPTKPIYAEISRSTLNEHDAKGNIIASHTETVFHVEYDDNTNTVFDTLAPQPTDETPSRLLIIDPSTSSLTFESTIHIAGAPVTWSTWATFTQSVGAVWDEPSYNIEADINMNGVIEISDGAAILQQQGIMDLDQNGAVDAADHNAFLTLLTTQSASADINMDGMVDALDLHEWVVMLRSSRVSAAATASN
ncbi:MAG: hypothetical protein COB69_03425 [Phycisphaera sp.]|nr:MAG: hypothetical protein COB69_03425 [Phycisphaera sp.]